MIVKDIKQILREDSWLSRISSRSWERTHDCQGYQADLERGLLVSDSVGSMILTMSGREQDWQIGRYSPVSKSKVNMTVHTHCIMLGHVFTVWNFADIRVNSMKLVTFTALPNILLFFQAELCNTMNKFICWNFHFCHWQSESRYGCRVSPVIDRYRIYSRISRKIYNKIST